MTDSILAWNVVDMRSPTLLPFSSLQNGVLTLKLLN